MPHRTLSCPACGAALPEETFQAELPGLARPCPGCQRPIAPFVFPAMVRENAAPRAGELALGSEETTCFYHAQRKAAAVCDSCARFLCTLCDLELHGQHLCPGCLESGKKKGRIRNLENERTLHDGIALGIATLPMLMWPFTIISAPLAFYYSIRHWKSPTSLLRRWAKFRFILALLLASLQIAGWIALGVFLLYGRHTQVHTR